jgi:hypothetical protein
LLLVIPAAFRACANDAGLSYVGADPKPSGPRSEIKCRHRHEVGRGAEHPRGARREGPADQDSSGKQRDQDAAGVTIGRALEVVATAGSGDKAVDQSDAAAVLIAEMCAAGCSAIVPGGVAAAYHNAHVERDENRVKLRDVLSGARFPLLPSVSISLVRELTVVSTW